jgi:hypothetical protein
VDAAGGGGAGDPEPGSELVVGVPLVQVGEREQGLGAGVEDSHQSPRHHLANTAHDTLPEQDQ